MRPFRDERDSVNSSLRIVVAAETASAQARYTHSSRQTRWCRRDEVGWTTAIAGHSHRTARLDMINVTPAPAHAPAVATCLYSARPWQGSAAPRSAAYPGPRRLRLRGYRR